MSEREDDEQWRQRFRYKIGLTHLEIAVSKLDARLAALEAKSSPPSDRFAEQLADVSRPRRKDWWDWLERQPTWIQALSFVVVPLVFMTLGALWFLLMYVLAKWL